MSEIDEKKAEFEALKIEAKELKIWDKIRGSKLPEMKKAIEEARIARDANPIPTPPKTTVDPITGNYPTLSVATEPRGNVKVAPEKTAVKVAPVKVAPKVAPVEAPKEPEVKKKFNMVVIRNGKEEIRTFSLAIHGENFASIAAGFANDRGYQMELIDTGKNITCPHCGQSFAPRS